MHFRYYLLIFIIGFATTSNNGTNAGEIETSTIVDIAVFPDRAKIAFRWKKPERIDYQINGNDLLIRTTNPIGPMDLEKIMSDMHSWLLDIRFGYDSILLVAKENIRYEVEAARTETKVTLITTNAVQADEERYSGKSGSRQRLDYLNGLTLLSKGDLIAAESAFKSLVKDDPRKIEYLRGLAYTQRRLGNWQESLKNYDRILKILPKDKDARREKNEIKREYGDRVNAETTYLHSSNEHQAISRVSLNHFISESWSTQLAADKLFYTSKALRLENGSVGTYSGMQHYFDFSLQRQNKIDRTVTELAALHHSGDAGFRVIHRKNMSSSSIQLGFKYKEPDHKHMESLAYGGARDQISLQYEYNILPSATTLFSVAYNRYALNETADAATSRSISVSSRYPLYVKSPFVDVSYSIAGEYVNHLDTKVDTLGESYSPLPLSTVEVHTLGLGMSDHFIYNLRGSSDIGYALDRFGSQGFFWGMSLDWQPSALLRVGAMLRRTKLWLRNDDANATESNIYIIGYF